jgi:hypothetical protein
MQELLHGFPVPAEELATNTTRQVELRVAGTDQGISAEFKNLADGCFPSRLGTLAEPPGLLNAGFEVRLRELKSLRSYA